MLRLRRSLNFFYLVVMAGLSFGFQSLTIVNAAPVQAAFSCNSLLNPLEVGVMIDAPPGFEVLLATPRFLLGREEHGRGDSLQVISRDDFSKLGWIGLRGDKEMHLPIYFEVKSPGLGTETKFAVLKYVFEVMKATSVVAFIADNNVESLGLHRKLGFTFVRTEERSSVYTLSRQNFDDLLVCNSSTSFQEFCLPRRGELRLVTVLQWNPESLMAEEFMNFVKGLKSELQPFPALLQTAVAEIAVASYLEQFDAEIRELNDSGRLGAIYRPAAIALVLSFLRQQRVGYEFSFVDGDADKLNKILQRGAADGLSSIVPAWYTAKILNEVIVLLDRATIKKTETHWDYSDRR